MHIEDNILRYYLKDAYFITGIAYAGKSTMARMLAERCGMTLLGENFHLPAAREAADPAFQPDICYSLHGVDWQHFVSRPPEEYERWIYSVGREAAGFEIAEIIAASRGRKVIVDTNLPLDLLHRLADPTHVAVMLSPQSMSVERFFDRSDPEKQFLLRVIESCPDPERVMATYREGLARINSRAHYDEFARSGFFTLVREDDGRDTREETFLRLARHFGLI